MKQCEAIKRAIIGFEIIASVKCDDAKNPEAHLMKYLAESMLDYLKLHGACHTENDDEQG